MLGVSVDDFLALNVVEVVFEDVLAQQVDERLDIVGHFLVGRGLLELRKVDVGKSPFKERNVELVREEHLHVFDRLLNA